MPQGTHSPIILSQALSLQPKLPQDGRRPAPSEYLSSYYDTVARRRCFYHGTFPGNSHSPSVFETDAHHQILLYVLTHILYNLLLHPLCTYPGPSLWAATRLPWTFHNLRGHLAAEILALHQRYGPVVRIAPDELSYTTGTAWKKIYGQRFPHEFHKCLDGRGIAGPGLRTNTVHGIVTAPHEKHVRLRRAIAPAFSERALREQEVFLQLYTDKLVTELRRACSRADGGEAREDIQRWYSLMAFDIVSDLAFGQPAGCLDAAEQPWLQVIGQRARSIVWFQAGMYYRLDGLMSRLAPKKSIEARRRHAELTAAKVAQRLAAQQKGGKGEQQQRRDFMSYILEGETEEHHQLSRTELTYMASSFIVAGSGTSASALAGITFLLGRNRDKLLRATTEVRDAFAASGGGERDDVVITVEAIARLPYLRAIVDEGMRLFPPSPSTLPRFVPSGAAGGEVIDGCWVPGGTAVGVHQFAAGRMEANFHRASEFLPERWLVGEGETAFAGDDRAAAQPFSYGPRNCIGQK